MANIERGDIPNPEISPEEITAFENKVRELVRNPKTDDLFPHTWTSRYRKGGAYIRLSIPEPGYEFEEETPENAVEFSTFKYLSTTANGHKFYEEQEFIVYLLGEKTIINTEKIYEYDTKGKGVISPSRKKAYEEAASSGDFTFLIKNITDQASFQESLKRQRFEEAMALLSSLTPEDEVRD